MDIYTLSQQDGLGSAVDLQADAFTVEGQIIVQQDIIQDTSKDVAARAQAYIDMLKVKDSTEFQALVKGGVSSTALDQTFQSQQNYLSGIDLKISSGDSTLQLQTATGSNATAWDVVQVLQGKETDNFSLPTQHYNSYDAIQSFMGITRDEVQDAINKTAYYPVSGGFDVNDQAAKNGSGLTWNLHGNTSVCQTTYTNTYDLTVKGGISAWKNLIAAS